MSGDPTMSHAGCFLIARSKLMDPNFRHTVILLLVHNAEGAFGLVVNRPAKAEGFAWPVFAGGPCPSPGLLLLHGHREWLQSEEESDEPPDHQLSNGIFTGDASCLEKASELADPSDVRLRVYSGYAGWGEGQLECELAAGGWDVVPATADMLFDTPLDEMWLRLSPPRIPRPSTN